MKPSSIPQPIFCDENPSFTLYLATSTIPVAAVSFWRSFLSPSGSGHVLALWQGDGTGKRDVAVFTDRLALGQLIVQTFLRHWQPFNQASLQDVSLREARFFVEMDLPTFYRVSCTASGIDMVTEWRAPRSFNRHASHTHADVRYRGSSPVVETTVGFCDQASIHINGHSVEGQVHSESGDEQTSAFVTLCETWSLISETREK